MATDTLDPQALRALLEWYVESGVDLALDEAPHDRYADSAKAPKTSAVEAAPARIATKRVPAVAPLQTSPRREAAPLAPDIAALAAQDAAAGASTLNELAARLVAFDHAPFRDMARHFNFAAGAPGARLMALDTAPGEAEETSGEPFCSREARLLGNMLAAIGHNRANAYLSYFSPWRPPGLASLTPQQIAIFAPFAVRHIEIAKPDVLLIFGDAPARAVLGSKETLPKLRGRMHQAVCGAHRFNAFVFPGLDSMTRNGAFKGGAWRDLRAARRLLTV